LSQREGRPARPSKPPGEGRKKEHEGVAYQGHKDTLFPEVRGKARVGVKYKEIRIGRLETEVKMRPVYAKFRIIGGSILLRGDQRATP